MMRGVVLKLKSHYAIVMTDDMCFYRVKRKDGMYLGQSIVFVENDIVYRADDVQNRGRSITDSRQGWRKKAVAISALAVCLVFLFWFTGMFGLFPGGLYSEGNAYYAVVSVDINPSVQLKIDKEKTVFEVQPLNKDGEKIIDPDLTGLGINDAVYRLITNAQEQNYLTSGQETILIASAMNRGYEKYQEEFVQEITAYLNSKEIAGEYNIVVICSNKDNYKKAQNNGLSLGKYELYVLGKGEISAEEIKGMKIKDIVSRDDIKNELKNRNKNKEQKELKKGNKKKGQVQDGNRNENREEYRNNDKEENEELKRPAEQGKNREEYRNNNREENEELKRPAEQGKNREEYRNNNREENEELKRPAEQGKNREEAQLNNRNENRGENQLSIGNSDKEEKEVPKDGNKEQSKREDPGDRRDKENGEKDKY